MTSARPDAELLATLMRSTSPAVNILQKLLGIGYDLDRPDKERAALWGELAEHLRTLGAFADQCQARAQSLDYLDVDPVTEQRALPVGEQCRP